ncbi:hypothetical protein BLA24_07400 [Streptomyces cinnamoneus]|uniref:DUF8017 domain-containing protein n=1 Tax=Streptomyces cinnamoneus TaxID=53446 RepID=A0A2G1XMV6_STRCJ|nr:hypothetical protein [Streptomyces cinnamoneus]PHQ52585.1 hypothetical protein BLA24_07400 [Streptomyces cinnamoneus]PPT16123.1 hypothetical protein CYQ11_27555 [Streptomyces cinnamoneus]
MWPGQQPPGGEQNPQQPNPYQSAGQQQPNPYQQPGYPQQPNPYQQPGGPQPGAFGQPGQPGQPQWQSPAGPPGAPQPGNGKKRGTVIALTAALAVVAAAVVTGVVVLKDDGGDDEGGGGKDQPKAATAPPSAPASPAQGSQGPEDNPRAGGEVKPVVDGWKVVVSSKRHNAFDVPPDWTVNPPTLSTGFEDDKGKPLVIMTSTAMYKKGDCTPTSSRGGAGTKGAQGAKSQESAAEIEAENWVISAFDVKQTGHVETVKAKPFKSDHGLSGQTASATVTGVNKTDKCSTDGKAYTVTYKDTSGDLATWVLYAGTGFSGELPDDTIKKIMSTLRPLSSS